MAYLRVLGNTQKQAAEAAGVSERSVRGWEADEATWAEARAEACSRWLNAAADAARSALLKTLKAGNAGVAQWLLERVDPALAPPKHRVSTCSCDLDFSTWEEVEFLDRVVSGEDPHRVAQDRARFLARKVAA